MLAASVALGLTTSLVVAYLVHAAWAPIPRIVATPTEPGPPVEAPAPPARTTGGATVPAVPASVAGERPGSSAALNTGLPYSHAAVVPVAASPMPVLHGVVMKGELAIAYLEDPVTKQVRGYRIGDSIDGSTVQAITADRVVLARVGGRVTARIGETAQPEPAVSLKVGVPSAAGGNPAGGNLEVSQTVVTQERQAIEERLAPARRRMLLEALLAAKPGDVVQAP